MFDRKASFGLAACGLLVLASAAHGAPGWIDEAELWGKGRVRYEWISHDNRIPPDQKDRNRFRYQLILGARVSPDERVDVGLQVASSQTATEGPSVTSQNVTFDDAFNDDPLFIDHLYVTYRPPIFEKAFKPSFTAGKFAVPYKSTRLTWDGDISMEGIYLVTAPSWFEKINLRSVNGIYVLEEENQGNLGGFSNGQDAYLWGEQLTASYKNLSGWVSYYHYVRPSLTARTSVNGTVVGNAAFGNNSISGNRLTSEFSIINAGAELKGTIRGWPAWIHGEWSSNESARRNPVNNRTEDQAFVVSAGLGKVMGQGDWAIEGTWGRVESDALLATMIDGDWFSGLGQTNSEGWRIMATYGVTKSSTLSLTFYDVDEENGVGSDPDQQLMQMDFSVKF